MRISVLPGLIWLWVVVSPGATVSEIRETLELPDELKVVEGTRGLEHFEWHALVTQDGEDALAFLPDGEYEDALLQLMVDGPGTLRLWARGEPMSVSALPLMASRVGGGTTWRESTLLIEPGSSTLSFSVSGRDPAWLDGFRFEPAIGVIAALDLSEQPNGMVMSGIWEGFIVGQDFGFGADDAIAAIGLDENQEAWIEMPVEGPRLVTFNMRLSQARDGEEFAFEVDGQRWFSLTDDGFFRNRSVATPVMVYLPEGSHSIRWLFRGREGDGATPWMDRLQIQSMDDSPIDLGSLIDLPKNVPWFFLGEDIWSASEEGKVGNQALLGGQGYLGLQLNGPSILETWVESRSSGTVVWMNGEETSLRPVFDEDDWKRYEYEASSDRNVVVLSLVPGVSIDGVRPMPSVSMAEALDSELDFTSEGWSGVATGTAPDGSDYAGTTSKEAWIESSVEGPGELSFWHRAELGATMEFEVDGIPTRVRSGEIAKMYLGEGLHAMKWQLVGGGNAEPTAERIAWLDQVMLSPGTRHNPLRSLNLGDLEEQSSEGLVLQDLYSKEIRWSVGESGRSSFSFQAPGPGRLVGIVHSPDDLEFTIRVGDTVSAIDDLALSEVSIDVELPDALNSVEFVIQGTRNANTVPTLRLTKGTFETLLLTTLEEAADTDLDLTRSGRWYGVADLDAPQEDRIRLVGLGQTTDPSSTFIETTVQGPGTLSYEAVGLSVMIDGVSASRSLGKAEHVITAGEHRIRWLWSGQDSIEGVYLDHVQFVSGESLWGRAFEFPANQGMHIVREIVDEEEIGGQFVGGSALKLALRDGFAEWSTSLSGPGYWSFRALPAPMSIIRVRGGSELSTGMETPEWWTLSGFMPSEESQLLIGLVANESPFLLDDFRYLPRSQESIDLNEALDTSLPITTGGAGSVWEGWRYGDQPAGFDAAKVAPTSLPWGERSEAWIATEISGPGNLSFRGRSLLTTAQCFINDVPLISLFSGSPEWVPVNVELPSGVHRVRWEVSSSNPNRFGEVWLDDVSFEPSDHQPIREELGLDPSSTVVSTGWRLQEEISRDGTALESVPSLEGERRELRFQVLGPKTLSFWYKVSSGEEDGLVVSTNGNERLLGEGTLASGDLDWRLAEIPLGKGNNEVGIAYVRGHEFPEGANRAWIDGLTLLPSPSLAEALDAPDLVFTTSGDVPFHGVSSQTAINGSFAGPAWLEQGQRASVETSLIGPGMVSFQWMPSRADVKGEFWINDERVVVSTDSGRVFCSIPPGTHVVKWEFVRLSGAKDPLDARWLDDVQFVGEEQSMNRALDLPDDMLVIAYGDWKVQGDVTSDGVDAVQGPSLKAGESAALELIVQNGGNSLEMSWWWRLDSPDGHGHAELRAAPNGFGSWIDAARPEIGWHEYKGELYPGDQRLTWRYRADAESEGPIENFWLDRLHVQVAEVVPVNEALDGGLSFRVGGNSEIGEWRGVRSFDVDEGESKVVINGVPLPGEEMWIETNVSGPGDLTFHWSTSSRNNRSVSFFIDDMKVRSIKRSGSVFNEESGTYELGRERVIVSIPRGGHTVRWTATQHLALHDRATEPTSLDSVHFRPRSQGILHAALDLPPDVIVITAGYNGTWEVTSASRDGVDGLIPSSLDAELGIGLPPRSQFGLWRSDQFPPEHEDWEYVVYSSDAGPVVAEISSGYVLRDGETEVERLYVVDNGNFVSAAQPLTLSKGLDSPLIFTTDERSPWSAALSAGAFDLDEVYFAGTGDSWIATEIEGPGSFAFSWMNQSSGSLGLWIDDLPIAGTREQREWVGVTGDLPEGWHRLEWRVNFGARDRAALDHFQFFPSAEGRSYQTWANDVGLSGELAGPLSDRDGDGVANLVDYALEVPADIGNEGSLVALETDGFFELQFYGRKANDLSYRAEFSSDLQSWSSDVVVEERRDLGNGWLFLRLRDPKSLSEGERWFGRVVVDLLTP